MLSYFDEKQRFGQWWVFVVPFLMLGITIFVTVQQLLYEQPVGNNPVPDSSIWILWVFSLGLLWFLWSFQLITSINKKGISVRVRPLLHKNFKWDDIDEMFIREYKPLREYGGYGIRYSKNGTAYNIKGKTGLQLVMKNGKRILIGTQRSKELGDLIEKIKDPSTRENYI